MLLGIEIGGTKLQAGVCDTRARLRVLVRRSVMREKGAAGILRQLEEIIPPLLRVHRIQKIGVGFGGPFDTVRGRVVRSFHISGWDGFELKRWFERRFKRPTVAENDTNCATLAEAVIGAGRGKRRVFYTNVGTGIGGGLAIDGRLYRGRFGAMEIGHTRLWHRDKWVIVETVSSGLAIERGTSTVEQAARCFGVAVANVITLLNPDIVVVGGGVSLAGERFFKPLRATVRRSVFAPFRHNFKIVPAGLGESVVVVGAALLAAGRGC
ncbi:MAG TPA: ROK family protein [Verrucomicrobiae bacterium]|nr:ROK family protein [Verrucomicrobiae bacterium]